jgi:lysylphosphatidylglycerol synthetase-like protein (DUF2156 family)
MSNTYEYIVDNQPIEIVMYEVKETLIGIRVNAIFNGIEIGEFDFIKLDECTYSGSDAAIFKQEFKRKGIYSFVINKVQEFYKVKIVPSKLLTPQGKRFWKNRLSKV